MAFLLLYIGEGKKFDKHTIAISLQTLEGAKPLTPSKKCLLMYDYENGKDLTTIRFNRDQETIMIDGMGEASLSAALHIQSSYPEDIHIIDEAYTFDLVLRGINSVRELEHQIKNAGGQKLAKRT